MVAERIVYLSILQNIASRRNLSSAAPFCFPTALGQRTRFLQIAIDYGVGGANRLGQNCQCGTSNGFLREDRSTEDKKIGTLPVLQIRIDNRILGGCPEDRSAVNLGTL